MTFTLRAGVKYQDGTPSTRASVKWEHRALQDGQGSARTGDLALVDSVDVVDATTVKFNLKQAYAPLLGALVRSRGHDVSQKVVDAMGATSPSSRSRLAPVPFILTEAVKNDHYTLEKNPDWWGTDAAGNKLPFLDKVIVKPILDADVRLTNLRDRATRRSSTASTARTSPQ
jgi:ABC-type transport system substrate-binding protein